MTLWCGGPPDFQPYDRIVSLVYHPPEIRPGTKGTIVSQQTGSLYAVQLPNGELHRWFAEGELEPAYDPNYRRQLLPGSAAIIKNTKGHPPHIQEGMTVRIIKVLERVPFYDLMIDGMYHRWLADFEMASQYVVQNQNR
jgi:hypothetical protein